jgi:hypothetical protein
MPAGDWGLVSTPNWPNVSDFRSLRLSTLRKPPEFRDFLQETGHSRNDRTVWLGREDSNLRMAESKSAALPLGDAPIACGAGPRGVATIVGPSRRGNPGLRACAAPLLRCDA